MKTNLKNCDCELCLYKTFPYNNPLANDKKKIIEAIVYHYIVRLSSLVKSRKDLNSYIIKFIMTINQSYLENLNELKTSINIMYKNLTDLGKCCRFSSNSSLTKLTHKEATYLKLIISSLGEGEEKDIKDKKEEVISPIKIIVDEVTDVINDVKTIVNDVQTVIEDVKMLASDIIPLVEECIMVEKKDISANETVPTAAVTAQDASGSYYSYCVIS